MRRNLTRTAAAMAVVLPLAFVAPGPLGPANATANDLYQYSLGTDGEKCGGGCPGGDAMCCRIVVAPAPPQ